jgi:UDPglucose--hexose-1-phosphate uridylyltransferase
MSELRLNVITKDWVIICPERSVRPSSFVQPKERPSVPAYAPDCPFCPGNEHLAEAEVDRVVDSEPERWRTRVVSNRYAALSPTTVLDAAHAGLRHRVSGFGIHEVIIDTPRHDLPAAQQPPGQLEALVATYRARYRACRADPRIAHVVIFKNHGLAAGTSLIHPHSQLVATPVVSYQVRDRIRTLQDHHALYGECVLCRLIAEEIEEGSRVVEVGPSFVAVVPYAALSSYHLWIFPRRHMASFAELRDEEIAPLAATLRSVLLRLQHGLGDPDYNYVIRSAPNRCAPEEFHWYISIVPRLTRTAGFELGSGIYVNDSFPESSAALLREVVIP